MKFLLAYNLEINSLAVPHRIEVDASVSRKDLFFDSTQEGISYQIYILIGSGLNNEGLEVRRDLFDFMLSDETFLFEVELLITSLWRKGFFISPWARYLYFYGNRLSAHLFPRSYYQDSILYGGGLDVERGHLILDYLRKLDTLLV